ncbi:MAG: DNA methylase [Peptococcaceae bacterium]|nr:DNA methylase [Peptococcaceae bacterium]
MWETSEKSYICIDLKSFYASVECIERKLDPLNVNLVVADESRTAKTICLSVSPALKSYGIPGRPRLFEVVEKVRQLNAERKRQVPGHRFSGESYFRDELAANKNLSLSYIVAKPRMALYIEYSTRIYQIYLKYIAPEDIQVYSIDEVFIDCTAYLKAYGKTPRELASAIINDIFQTTGITATAGVGTNLYLAKVAMDIVAKHKEPDKNGARIAELDELTYRRLLWSHRPLTDFWRIGKGYAQKLEDHGLYTMGDIARCSLGKPGDKYNEDLLYGLFGVNAELLIDHAWGWEPCTIADIKAYKPASSSTGGGQVLPYPYDYEKTKLVVKEMVDMLALNLVEKQLVTNQIVLTIGYDKENLGSGQQGCAYDGEITLDRYGRKTPKHSHGTVNLDKYSSSEKVILQAVLQLYEEIINKKLLVRRIYITANHVIPEEEINNLPPVMEQLDLFTDYEALAKQQTMEQQALEKERKIQEAVIGIKKQYGKNAIIKGMNMQEGATARTRNKQIGGHKA